MTYFIAVEPTGSNNGVYEVWTINGQTREIGVQKYSESQIGPQKAVDSLSSDRKSTAYRTQRLSLWCQA
ncbi:hypothetical protein CYV19_17315 [Natronobacterium gregoryi SP2]|uniref:Uncharacterized protein n=1 Tax=Natronobacterium gregoryi (strain ATCC 43098 / DSM 3393 / CCM 3738 / CIP 104747 / IAM 13177 / JCM 8860 / NBRC 102187 / NCIMB 2189 / SP2) TaxID=797304 RepID=L9XQZ3_NATGS|nr:hypothetical protein C490_14997 [Natronobacterium gregoryi SP2]PLK18708.1 hypothetical protein CYV19_17315 [Natronobacterium gregoryi SP2]